MPLRAIINNEEKVSISYSDEEWILLKRLIKKGEVKVVLPCCKQSGFLRTSSKGFKHFIHAKGQNVCDWKPESIEHIAAKVEVIRACIESGWEAIPEFSENEWRADVLAKKNDHRIAFEIQWSSQTSETTEYRQNRYKESDVRGCWFFRTVPKQYRDNDDGYIARQDIPFFEIKKLNSEKISVYINEKNILLYDFVKSLLNREIKFCEKYRTKGRQEFEITFYEIPCWKCSKMQHIYSVNGKLKSCCGAKMYFGNDMHPTIVKAVLAFAQDSHKYKIGEIKKRYSKTVQNSYMSFGCYYCDALFGEFFLHEDMLEAYDSGRTENVKILIDMDDIVNKVNHWCISSTREFCE